MEAEFGIVLGVLFSAIGVALGAALGALLFTCAVIVTPKEVATITLLGKFSRAARPGLSFKGPWPIQIVDRRMSAQLQSIGETVRVKTRDNAYVDMPLQVFYQVDESSDESISRAAYNLNNPPSQILFLACKEVRSGATGMSLDDLFTDKDQLEARVMEELSAFVRDNGWLVRNVVIDEPTPSEEIQIASNDVIASLRQQDAATAKAEAIRIERVGEAKADAEALKQRASAFADSRKTIADGMVNAARAMDDVEGLTSGEIMRILEGVDWRDALISCSKGEGTLIIDSASGGHGLSQVAGLIEGMPKSRASE